MPRPANRSRPLEPSAATRRDIEELSDLFVEQHCDLFDLERASGTAAHGQRLAELRATNRAIQARFMALLGFVAPSEREAA